MRPVVESFESRALMSVALNLPLGPNLAAWVVMPQSTLNLIKKSSPNVQPDAVISNDNGNLWIRTDVHFHHNLVMRVVRWRGGEWLMLYGQRGIKTFLPLNVNSITIDGGDQGDKVILVSPHRLPNLPFNPAPITIHEGVGFNLTRIHGAYPVNVVHGPFSDAPVDPNPILLY